MIDKAVQDALAADATLVALLGTYRGAAAIFVQNEVPSDFVRGGTPYIALRDGPNGGYLDGDRKAFSADVEVLVLALDQGDAAACEAAALRVRAVLDGADIAPTGYVAGGTAVVGPTPADPDDLTFGRRLTATMILTEE